MSLQPVPTFNPLNPQSATQPFNFASASFYPAALKPTFTSAPIKRHQSFHSFHTKDSAYSLFMVNDPSGKFISPHRTPTTLNRTTAINNPFTLHFERPLPSYPQTTSFSNLNQLQPQNVAQPNQFFVRNPFNTTATTPRVVGRKESQMSLAKTTPKPPTSDPKLQTSNSNREKRSSRASASDEKRFGSLEIKKHRCYSPTFYSLRCKKHAKRRPIVYAIPKKPKSQVAPSMNAKSPNTSSRDFQNLTDSIQIFEQNSSASQEPPKPAPRCKRSKTNVIYANFSTNSSTEDAKVLDSSNDGSETFDHEISTTKALVHETNQITEKSSSSKSSPLTSKSAATSPSNKDSPTVMVRPSFVKPKVESPKGALSLQIQAKLKPLTHTEPSSTASFDENKEANADCLSFVPEMPILDTQSKWNTNKLNPNQVCFFFYFCRLCSCSCMR